MVNILGYTNTTSSSPATITFVLSCEGWLKKNVGSEWTTIGVNARPPGSAIQTGIPTSAIEFGGVTMPVPGSLTHISLSSVDGRGNATKAFVCLAVNAVAKRKYFINKSNRVIGDIVKFSEPFKLQAGDVLGLRTVADSLSAELSTATLLIELSL